MPKFLRESDVAVDLPQNNSVRFRTPCEGQAHEESRDTRGGAVGSMKTSARHSPSQLSSSPSRARKLNAAGLVPPHYHRTRRIDGGQADVAFELRFTWGR